MIFITTGTSLPHDELIRKMDSLKGVGFFEQDNIYAQIGNGNYLPKHMTWLRFVGNMEEVYGYADVIISNCGAGTIMENVTKGRKLIVVQNPGITGGHEWELVSKLEKMGCLVWCKDVKNIKDCVEAAKKMTFNKFTGDEFDISLITDLLENKK